MIYAVNATALTPLSFRAGRSPSETATLEYIPGSALLGSLVNAHCLLRNKPAELEAFLFQPGVRLGNLYPASSPEETEPSEEKPDAALPVYPLPATAHRCKRFDHHGMHDHLCRWTIFALSDHTDFELLEQVRYCGYANGQAAPCREERIHRPGFYRRGATADEWRSPAARQMLRMRTGINRATGTVQEAILFSRSVLAEGSRFWGVLQVDEAIHEAFEAFVQEAGQAGLIRVGNNRTRGLGKLAVKLQVFEPDTTEQMQARLQAFNAKFQPMIPDGLARHAYYLPLTLTSDAILLDRLLRHRPTISDAYLAEQWGIAGTELVYSNVQRRRVMGWNSLWRLPKPDELALAMGSVFLFGLPAEPDDRLLAKLLKMQTAGIGIRRREGFGQLLVASPFHWEVNNV